MRFSALIVVAWMLTGCQMGYYAHLVSGHWSLMRQRQPIDSLLTSADIDAELASRLQLVQQVRVFAEQELALPVEAAYADYVHLDRDWVVWNLFAAPEFSLQPQRWCYPVAGCVNYRGYFDRQRAEQQAQSLRAADLDVYGSGAMAYSTLGWFDDPVTSIMLKGSEAWLVELLFHELAHRRFYLKGDTRFSESLATAVAAEGLRRWLQAGIADGSVDTTAQLHQARQQHQQARDQVYGWVVALRAQLSALYASALSPPQMRAEKAALQQQLRQRYQAALAMNAALAPWQDWFAGPLNNAQLNTLADYHSGVPTFEKILRQCDGRWPCFWEKVEALASLPEAQRQQQLDQKMEGKIDD